MKDELIVQLQAFDHEDTGLASATQVQAFDHEATGLASATQMQAQVRP